jgi:SAM-dependent methyltransferase
MRFPGRGNKISPSRDARAEVGRPQDVQRGRGLRRFFSAILLLGLIAALTRPGRRLGRALARRLDARVECFTEPGSNTYVHFFAPIFEHLYRRVAEDTERELAARGRIHRPLIIDLGCGPGDLAVAMSRRLRDARIVGIDLSPSMLLWAGRHATTDGRLRFIVGDAADLPFDNASIDLVVSTLSLHHWKKPAAVFAEVSRVLRPGGVALIYDISVLSLRTSELETIARDVGLDPDELQRERVKGGFGARLFVRFRLEGPEIEDDREA